MNQVQSCYGSKPCRRCRKVFRPTSANHRYCSEACKRGQFVCEMCGKLFVPSKNALGRFCSTECHYEHLQPTGTRKSLNGYMIVKVAPGTPGCITYGATMDRWMFEHRWVMQQTLGRMLEPHETVHHKNGDKMDNRPDNLELWRGRHGRGIRANDYHCPGCRCFEKA